MQKVMVRLPHVKMTEQLLYKAIPNVLLEQFDFEYLICKTVDLINKRPIAFKDSLRNLPDDELPLYIIPEILIKLYKTVTLNIIRQFQFDDHDLNWELFDVVQDYEELLKLKSN